MREPGSWHVCATSRRGPSGEAEAGPGVVREKLSPDVGEAAPRRTYGILHVAGVMHPHWCLYEKGVYLCGLVNTQG